MVVLCFAVFKKGNHRIHLAGYFLEDLHLFPRHPLLLLLYMFCFSGDLRHIPKLFKIEHTASPFFVYEIMVMEKPARAKV